MERVVGGDGPCRAEDEGFARMVGLGGRGFRGGFNLREE